jgi:hypothetical protein
VKNRADFLSAEPVKEFFVTMLTRDIDLEDAILDLLDNCVDGAVRMVGKKNLLNQTPYAQYRGDITITATEFSIKDNCGGIPEQRKAYAFRMGAHPGSRDLTLPTVGTYGIGMKRAMFKMGRECLVQTKTDEEEYSVLFSRAWFDRPDEWQVPVSYSPTGLEDAGTCITVKALRDGVRNQFSQPGFLDHVRERIATHYALILAKGFEVTINGEAVTGKPLRLRFSDDPKGVKPFVFRGNFDDVEVFLAVGFTMPIPSEAEANSDEGEMSEGTYRAAEAGWTVVCNDRTVVYSDKTTLTGWGEAPVPRYHNQFIAISGIVEFRSDDASKLPTTTTKRGIDASSDLYLRVKQKMREGMKLFTDFTYKWKGPDLVALGKEKIREAEAFGFAQLKRKAGGLRFSTVGRMPGEQYKPRLPMPSISHTDTVRISFSRPRGEVEALADRLFGNPDTRPSIVGERCFTLILQRTERE